MCETQFNSKAEWLMFVVGKGKVKLSLLIARFILHTALSSYTDLFTFHYLSAALLITNMLFIFHLLCL